MARISIGSEENVFKIHKWLGINENPDGDTQLSPGEAAEMRNFKITRDGNLQLRPGCKTIHAVRSWTGPFRGIWNGKVGDAEHTVFAAGGALYKYDFTTNAAAPILRSGVTVTDAPTFFFGYGGKLYAMNGYEYIEWDGANDAIPVAGYRPLVAVAVPPAGGGTQLEQVNRLNGLRRVWVSPNGSAKVFNLPEKGLASIDYVRIRATGADCAPETYSADLTNGTVTFTAAPASGTNSIEIGYTHPDSFCAQVMSMRFAEIFNGATDNRVFLYGDGTNRAIYSGLDYDGRERADYFPDLNVLDIGTENTPITALIRHYAQLAVFKSDSAYSVQYGTISLSDGRTTAAFYVTPANRIVGNEAPGQVQLVNNSPRTLSDSTVYEWLGYSGFSANLTSDERQSRVISHRVHATLSGMSLRDAYTFNDRERQEYYILQGGTAVVNSYATDTWYIYRDFNFTHLLVVAGALYGCTASGELAHISRRYQGDNGTEIEALWRSGSLAFARDWQKKYAARIFVTMKPETKAQLFVTVRTNRKSEYAPSSVSLGLAGFSDTNFRHWSFGTNRQPQMKRLKLKAKKFSYLQLIFESSSNWSTATVLSAAVRLRYAGDIR
jgi:hypothetical protein